MNPHPNVESLIISNMADLHPQAISLCHDRTLADDLVQETVYRALLHQDQFKEGSSVGAWMYTIMRNYFYTMKRRKYDYEDPDDVAARKMPYVEDPIVRIELRQVTQAIDRMPAAWRDPIYLMALDGITSPEIAESRAVSDGTIRTRLNRARAALVKAGH